MILKIIDQVQSRSFRSIHLFETVDKNICNFHSTPTAPLQPNVHPRHVSNRDPRQIASFERHEPLEEILEGHRVIDDARGDESSPSSHRAVSSSAGEPCRTRLWD